MSGMIVTGAAEATIEKKEVREDNTNLHRSVVIVRLTANGVIFKNDEVLVYNKGPQITELGVPHLLRRCTTPPSVSMPPRISDDGTQLIVTYDTAVVPAYRRDDSPEAPEVTGARLLSRIQSLYETTLEG